MALFIAPPLKTSVIVLAHLPEDSPRTLPLADTMTVGRLGYGYEGEPIRLADPGVSAGRHCKLQRTLQGAQVEDLGSTNGTTLNGVRLRVPALLHVGDEIRIGNSFLRFEHTVEGDSWLSSARPLVDAVLASPSDDRPRLVLADWLSEHGDRRGEFIACQLAATPAALARAQVLLAEHELAWLRPLPVPVERWTFARGFLATVQVRDVAGAQALRSFHPLAAIEPLSPVR